jgi:hypothetical protein
VGTGGLRQGGAALSTVGELKEYNTNNRKAKNTPDTILMKRRLEGGWLVATASRKQFTLRLKLLIKTSIPNKRYITEVTL